MLRLVVLGRPREIDGRAGDAQAVEREQRVGELGAAQVGEAGARAARRIEPDANN